MPIFCFHHKHCEQFFKEVQADMAEENEYSPAFVRNKHIIENIINNVINNISDSIVTEQRIIEIIGEELNGIFLVLGDPDDYQSLVVTLLEDLMFRYGVNSVTTLVGLPVTKQSVGATVGVSETLSLAAAMKPGQVINIKVAAVSNITITIPSSNGWFVMNDEDTFDLETDQVAEINIWCTGIDEYSVKVIVKE